jgi:glycopeptide antibiotics resistance protein
MGRGAGWIGEAVERLAPGLFIVVVAVVAIGGVHLLLRDDAHRRSRWTRTVALAAVVGIILVATLGAHDDGGAQAELKLIPFGDLVHALAVGTRVRGAFAELTANVLLFVPFGLMLRIRYRTLSLAQVAAIAFTLSFVIETLQLLVAAGRVANVTDVVTNTIGAIIGAALMPRTFAAFEE